MADELTNEEEIEENLAVSFEAEQSIYQAERELEKIEEEGKSFGHPSYPKYAILFTLAGIIDLVDLLDVTGMGIIVSKAVSFSFSAGILIIMWLTNTKYKKAKEYSENLEERIHHLQLAIAQNSRRASTVARFLGKTRIPGARRASRGIMRGMVKIQRLANKNPATKILIGGALNLIPILAMFNLMVVWIYMVYRDEKKTYIAAREMGGEAVAQI